MNNAVQSKEDVVPCCPELGPNEACDTLDFFYRLIHNVSVGNIDRRQIVPVEVKLHFRLTRCPGPLAIGDLLYTTTLLPGEKVRLFTSDRIGQLKAEPVVKDYNVQQECCLLRLDPDACPVVPFCPVARASSRGRGNYVGQVGDL